MEKVNVVYGEDEAGAFAFGSEGSGLVDGVPDVEVGHGEGELASNVVAFEVADVVAESTDIVFGDKECDVEFVGEFAGVLLVPTTIVEGNLAKPAHGMA